MKKTKTIEYTICDFEHDSEEVAVGVVQPSGKDACQQHLSASLQEVRLPDELGGDMSGLRLPVNPGYVAKLKIVYKEKNG